jgi:hypothetical protein
MEEGLIVIQLLKNYKMADNQKLGAYLEQKYAQYKTEWTQYGNIVSFLVYIPGLRSPNIFRWEIEGENIYSTNGSANTVTPELDMRKHVIDDRKQTVSVELMRIYNFIKQYHLEEGQPIEIVLDKANKEFGLSQGELEEIFIKVEKQLYQY